MVMTIFVLPSQKNKAIASLASMSAMEMTMVRLFIQGLNLLLYYINVQQAVELGIYMTLKDLDIMEVIVTYKPKMWMRNHQTTSLILRVMVLN